jgi:UDP-glucuronate 4-epimerase
MGGILGVTPDLVFDSRKPGDVVRTYADISLAGRELGYCPAVSIPEGLKRFLDWLRPNSETK